MKVKNINRFAVNKLKKGTDGYAGKGMRADYIELDILKKYFLDLIKEYKKEIKKTNKQFECIALKPYTLEHTKIELLNQLIGR